MARQFNLIPPICEQAEYHMFQREKVEVQLPELFHKIGGLPCPAPPSSSPRPSPGSPLPFAPPISPALPLPRSTPAPALAPPSPSPQPVRVPLSPALLGVPGLTLSSFPLPGVGAMTWSPLACGIVSGKYDSGIPPYSRASLKVKEQLGQGRAQGGTGISRDGPSGQMPRCRAGLVRGIAGMRT